MAEEQRGAEITNPVLGSIKVFGMDPNMLFTVLGFAGTIGIGTFLWFHNKEADARDAVQIKSTAEVAQVLKDNNKEIAQTLKESNKELANILREMAKSTREQNCLLAIDQTKRAQMVEFCKRLSQ